jgi:Restriction endonuclease BglII
MDIVAEYSFKKGREIIVTQFPEQYDEVCSAIREVDAETARVKKSREITMPGKLLYSPIALNNALLRDRLYQRGWKKPVLRYQTTVPETNESYSGYIEGDGEKGGLGLEVQFGKYAFLGWDIFGKMPIFALRNYFQAAIEVVPMASFSRRKQMSSGIGCFDQIKAMLELRGESDLDIPVLVLGIAPDRTTPPGDKMLTEEDDESDHPDSL